LDATKEPRLSQPLLRDRLGPVWPYPSIVALPLARRLPRAAAAVFAFVAVFVLAARGDHPEFVLGTGAFSSFIEATAPVAAASVASYALYRPWRALLLVVALTPFWNAAYVSWQAGPFQIILQTAFIAALAVGVASTRPAATGSPFAAEATAAGRAGGFAASRFAEVAVVGLIGIAVLSTIASPNVTLSATVLMHGILEPIALAALVVALRPSARGLIVLGIALGLSVGLGTVLNVAQSLPTMTSLASIQLHRLLFARASFYNVGLFAAVAAMTVPFVIAGLAGRRSLGLPRWAVALLIAALAASVAGLFLSLSKSAWIASAGGTMLVSLLLIHSWRRRLALILAGVAVSTLLIPWPALVLQVAPSVNSGYRSVMVSLIGESRFDSWNPATLAGRGSLSERYYAVEGAVSMALANPVLGVGLDRFGINYDSFDSGYRPPAARDDLDHAHSFFPEIAAELGLVAAFLVFVIYAAVLWAVWRVYRAASDALTRIVAAGLLASIVSWLVVATAFGCDIYRPGRDLSSDVVVSAIVLGAAISLARTFRADRADATDQASARGSAGPA
jgi:O-antigen ligase